MLRMNEIYHGDCLEVMKSIESSSIDLILCDPPYGTMKGAKLKGWEKQEDILNWDIQINIEEMMKEYSRILRMNGTAIIFSQEPYTHKLRNYSNTVFDFKYPLIWVKNHFANPLCSKKAPVSYFEDLSVFGKNYDAENTHPLRKYFDMVLSFINIPKSDILAKMGGGADHMFRTKSIQFDLCTEKMYNKLIDTYKIDKFELFMPYSELKQINSKYDKTFNLNGEKKLSNVLNFSKDYSRLHPTQKPLALCEYLIKTYSNEGDLVLDNCCGSGTTCLAAKNLGRNYIGIEKDETYFNIAMKRLNDA